MSDESTLHDDMKEIRRQLEDIYKLLNGNGKLGIVGMVLVLWRSYVWVASLCGVVVGALIMKLFDLV